MDETRLVPGSMVRHCGGDFRMFLYARPEPEAALTSAWIAPGEVGLIVATRFTGPDSTYCVCIMTADKKLGWTTARGLRWMHND